MTEAKLERRFRAADRDLSSLYAGYYVAELLNELTDDADPHPELFDAASETLLALSGGRSTVLALVVRFELLALRILGHLPALDACVECGKEAPATGRAAIGLLAGGVLCAACRPGKKQVVSVQAVTLRIMRHFSNPQSDVWRRIEIDRSLRGELRGVLNQYLCHLLGRRPRMHGYLGILAT